MERWWEDSNAVSEAQGVCRKGISSLPTAMLLQEIKKKKVFVAYLNMSKAFDRVRDEGMFYQLREIGITGKTWRMLYTVFFRLTARCG